MTVYNKYKSSIFLNMNGYLYLNLNSSKNNKFSVFTNYLFKKRSKIIRSFLILYSIILILSPFNNLFYKSSLKIKNNFNYLFLLLTDNNNFLFNN